MKTSFARFTLLFFFLLVSFVQASASVTGNIVLDTGTPIAGVIVRAYAPESREARLLRLSSGAPREPMASVVSDRGGSFALEAKGAFDIEFLSEGHAPLRLRARNGEDLGGVVLNAAQGRRGMVVANGAPLRDATIRFIGNDGAEWTTHSDERGEYAVPDPTGWAEEVYVTAESVAPLRVLRGTDPMMNVDFTLPPQTSIGIRVNARVASTVTVAAGGIARLAQLRPDARFSAEGLRGSVDEAWIDGQPAKIADRDGFVELSADPGVPIRIISARGPVEGADVTLTNSANPFAVLRETSGPGRRFPTPPAGVYQLHVDAPGYVSRDEQIEIGAATKVIEVTLEDAATITGEVVARSRRPVPAAFVMPTDADGAPLILGVTPIFARSGSDGRFALRGLPASELRLLASRRGYGSTTTVDSVGASAGSVTGGVTIELAQNVTVAGIVSDEEDNAVASANVLLLANTGEISASTGTDGRFEISAPAGTYDVSIRADGFARRDIPSVDFNDVSRPLQVRMSRAHALSGRVMRRGVPLAGVDVAAAAGDQRLNSITGPDGTFSFDLPAGLATLTATREGEAGRVTRLVTVPVTDAITLNLDGGRDFRGVVLDKATGAPVDDFEVRLAATDDSSTTGMVAAAQHPGAGAFVIENVPAVPVRVAIVAPGYAPFISKIVDAADDDRASEFALEKSLSIAGVVTDERGRPLRDVMVIATAPDIDFLTASTLTPAYTNDEGEYVLLDVRPGDKVLFRKENFVAVQRAITSGNSRVDVIMSPSVAAREETAAAPAAPVEARTISGFVAGVTQEEIALTMVHVESPLLGSRTVAIDTNGRFIVDGVIGDVSIFAKLMREDGSSKSSRIVASRGVEIVQLHLGVGVARGTVTNEWAGALLTFTRSGDPSGERAVARVTADAGIEVEGLEPGRYDVVARVGENARDGVAMIDEGGTVSFAWN